MADFLSLFCAIAVLVLVLSILLGVWVYRDAEKRGMSGVLWLLVVLIAGIIGLVIYFGYGYRHSRLRTQLPPPTNA